MPNSRIKVANKQDYGHSTREEYEIFLKSHMLEVPHAFYTVASFKPVKTTSGPMIILKLVTDIENPSLEVVAECRVNGENLYLWRNKCWMIAVDNSNHPICQFSPTVRYNSLHQNKFICNKVLLLYRVGTDNVI